MLLTFFHPQTLEKKGLPKLNFMTKAHEEILQLVRKSVLWVWVGGGGFKTIKNSIEFLSFSSSNLGGK